MQTGRVKGEAAKAQVQPLTTLLITTCRANPIFVLRRNFYFFLCLLRGEAVCVIIFQFRHRW